MKDCDHHFIRSDKEGAVRDLIHKTALKKGRCQAGLKQKILIF